MFAMKRIVFLLALLAVVRVSAFDIAAVVDGKPEAAIICDETAPNQAWFAAIELQNIVTEISGCRLPIFSSNDKNIPPAYARIYIGKSALAKSPEINIDNLKHDGFKIVGGNKWLAIVAHDNSGKPIYAEYPWDKQITYNSELGLGAFGDYGILNGVYYLLENSCGIRWFWPGKLGTIVPKSKTVKLSGADVTKEPVYEYRHMWFCNFQNSPEGALWYRRLGLGGPAPVTIIHSFNRFLKYKDSHPEYFALIDGKRDFGRLSTIGGGNLCLSNPEVIKQWISDINEFFDENPDQNIYPLCPNDGLRKICECPECQAQISNIKAEQYGFFTSSGGKYSDYIWNFINEVAKGVAVKHPDKYIGSFAYSEYSLAPANLKHLDSHVVVMICKESNEFRNPEYRNRIDFMISQWKNKVDHIYIWEYYLARDQWNGCPMFFPEFIAGDLRRLKGFSKGEFIQAELWNKKAGQVECPGLRHLNIYITSKLYWDTDLDLNVLLDEYYKLFYGPAESDMKEFWNTAADIWCNSKEASPVNIYTKEKLARLENSLQNARNKTALDSDYRKRIDIIANEFAPFRDMLSRPLISSIPETRICKQLPDFAAGYDNLGAWKDIAPLCFYDPRGCESSYKTYACMAWDDRFLYALFINYEPEMSKLKTLAKSRDEYDKNPIFLDDSVELFICPDVKNRGKCFQFVVNANGMISDSRRNLKVSDPGWNSNITAKVWKENNRWIAALKIPFKDLGVIPSNGSSFAVNLYRNRFCGSDPVYSCWSPTVSTLHYVPERFGIIKLQSED